MGCLHNKVTVITGASSGIGKAIAEKFAAHGANVVLSGRNRNQLESVAKGIIERGGRAAIFCADVAQRQEVDALFEFTVKEFGRVDILVNSAGYGLYKKFMDMAPDEIDSQIAVNVNGLCNTTYAALKYMLEQHSGRMINIGSIASLRPCANYSIYSTVKHAVYGFSRAIYEEYRAEGIRVNVLCPASVITNFYHVAGIKEPPYPPEQQIQPEDVAEAALYCASAPDTINIESITMWPVCQDTLYR